MVQSNQQSRIHILHQKQVQNSTKAVLNRARVPNLGIPEGVAKCFWGTAPAVQSNMAGHQVWVEQKGAIPGGGWAGFKSYKQSMPAKSDSLGMSSEMVVVAVVVAAVIWRASHSLLWEDG